MIKGHGLAFDHREVVCRERLGAIKGSRAYLTCVLLVCFTAL